MKGFFTPQETQSVSRPDGKILSCISCGAYQHCASPKIEVQGKGGKGIMIIGSSPESYDDKDGQLYKSKAGKFLAGAFKKVGVDLYEDCYLTHALKCFLPITEGNRIPTAYEIDCCRVHLMRAIKKYQPKVIVIMGNAALKSVIGGRWKRDLDNIDKWRGWLIPDQELKAWICPIFNYTYVHGIHEKRKEVMTIWEQDIENIATIIGKPIRKYVEPNIEYLTDETLVKLNDIKTGNIAFDYETTGLKPHANGHKIVCCSVAYTKNDVYVFMIPEFRKDCSPFINLLQNPNVGKIAQNMKYEDTWSIVRLGVTVVNWFWDTMQCTHVFDNRKSVTGLKFQTYVQFGIIDYESEVSPYLKGVEPDNANSLNRIMELVEKPGGAHLLMKYCAYDSIYEYRLSLMQRRMMANIKTK